jgi:dGTPase
MTAPKWRTARLHTELGKNNSIRDPFQKDRDRLIHCSAFRRLATITQVVSPEQGYVLHNRLTHALKVAQIGRRMAERLLSFPKEERKANMLGGLAPDVVEAAGLAHDLGHPPFGHAAEKALQAVALEIGLPDSFEGNAQSLRIVGALAIRSEQFAGLNLTRATINAILKYPWQRGNGDPKRSRKWGVYSAETELFQWAREPLEKHLGFDLGERKTLEAELMDFADDIAYSVFDLEDFTKAGKIPLGQLLAGPANQLSIEAESFLQKLADRRKREKRTFKKSAYVAALGRLKEVFPTFPRYLGTNAERAFFRNVTSTLVGRFMNSVSIRLPERPDDRLVAVPEEKVIEVDLLKELTFAYVVYDASLANQQAGYQRIVSELFKKFFDDAKNGHIEGLPYWCQEALADVASDSPPINTARVVMDFVASLTEAHAYQLYQRVSGISAGVLFAPQF